MNISNAIQRAKTWLGINNSSAVVERSTKRTDEAIAANEAAGMTTPPPVTVKRAEVYQDKLQLRAEQRLAAQQSANTSANVTTESRVEQVQQPQPRSA